MADKREWNEIRIRGISSKVMEDVKNIAHNSGLNMSTLLKPEITKIVNSYPERMRMPPKKN